MSITSGAFTHFRITHLRITHHTPYHRQLPTCTYQTPKPAVSTALFRQNPLSVLLIKRAKPPNKHLWALPGGSLNPHESLIQAAHRELFEETSIPSHHAHLLPYPIQNVLVPHHNPTYSISVFTGVYTGHLLQPIAADDAAYACFCQIQNISNLNTVSNLESTIQTALTHIQRVHFFS